MKFVKRVSGNGNVSGLCKPEDKDPVMIAMALDKLNDGWKFN